ncbi:hypothetical protein PMIN02_004785 [Paraphaeosphaeria minitans]
MQSRRSWKLVEDAPDSVLNNRRQSGNRAWDDRQSNTKHALQPLDPFFTCSESACAILTILERGALRDHRRTLCRNVDPSALRQGHWPTSAFKVPGTKSRPQLLTSPPFHSGSTRHFCRDVQFARVPAAAPSHGPPRRSTQAHDDTATLRSSSAASLAALHTHNLGPILLDALSPAPAKHTPPP